MDEYTAYVAATTGDLVAALEGTVDDELLDGAVGILRALVAGGPAEDIGDYAEGPRALRLVLERLRTEPSTAEQGLLAHEVVQLVEDAAARGALDAHRPGRAGRAGPRGAGRPALARHRGTRARRRRTFWSAERLALHVGVDSFPAILERLERDPFNEYWWQAMQRTDAPGSTTCSPSRTHTSCPPSSARGRRSRRAWSDYRRHAALETLVTGLERFPGSGWSHVRTALSSPVIRSRNMALRTLAGWGRPAWPEDVEAALEAARDREPDEGVRERIRRLLADRPLDG